MLKFGIWAVSPLALAVLAAAPAQAQTYSPQEVKVSVTTADLGAVVGALGHEVVEINEAEQMVLAQDDAGGSYFLFGTACDVGGVAGCQGINMQVLYDLSPDVTYERVAEANYEQAAVQTWVDFEEKRLGVTRYQVLDYGATMANIRENVVVLLDIAPIAAAIAAGIEVEEEDEAVKPLT